MRDLVTRCRAEDLPIDLTIAAKNVNGGKIRSFLASTPPMPDESLIGWLARDAALNVHRSLSKVLAGKIGLKIVAPTSLAASRRDEAELVAFLLKADVGEVEKRAFPVLANAAPTPRIDFFGAPVRPHYRNLVNRRVSPLALRQSGHHRAIWELRPLAFDPTTMEMLLQTCPVCGSSLGWRRTFGICFCDRCKDAKRRPTVDLREFPQPLVEVEDIEALRFVAALVDPLCSDPSPEGMRLSPEVREMSRGELFDLAVFLAGVLENSTRPPGAGPALRFTKPGGMRGLAPDCLAVAGRAIIEWPRGFFRVADTLRQGMTERRGSFGLVKELGNLLRAKREARMGARLDALLEGAVAADVARTDADALLLRRKEYRSGNRINVREAARRFGIDQDRFVRLAESGMIDCVRHRRIIVFDRAGIEAVAADRADMHGGMRTASILGVPLGALPDLTARGLIEKIEGAVLGMMREQEQYRRSATESLVDRLNERVMEGRQDLDQRLTLAASRLFVGPKPWGEIVEAVLSGAIHVRALKNKQVGILDRMAVDPMELGLLAARLGQPLASDPDGMTNYVEASDYFGVPGACLGEVAKASLLPALDRINLRLKRRDLDAFAEKYLFTGEVARRLQLPRTEALEFLKAQRLSPVLAMVRGKYQLWSKAEVQMFFVADCHADMRRLGGGQMLVAEPE